MLVIDNFYPRDLYSKALKEIKHYDYKYYWKDIEGFYYWNKQVDLTNNELIADMWQFLLKNSNVNIENLTSCYVNLMTNGSEGYPHVDSTESSVTFISYI